MLLARNTLYRRIRKHVLFAVEDAFPPATVPDIENFISAFLQETIDSWFTLPRMLDKSRAFAYGMRNIATIVRTVDRLMIEATNTCT